MTKGPKFHLSSEQYQLLTALSAFRLGDHHLVLEIDCPSPSAGMGDAAAIATWGTLRAADDLWCLEDLQGIPKRYESN